MSNRAANASELFNFLSASRITGESSYDVWKSLNPDGTPAEFLEELRGDSSYEWWKSQAGNENKTEEDYIKSLKVASSNYDFWLSLGNTGTPEEYLNSLKGNDGKSAYEFAKAGGYTGTEEEFAKKLADEYSGNSGVSSWNDLTDKPFYEEVTRTEILPKTKLQLHDDSGQSYCHYDPFTLLVDSKYIVNYDGVEYELVAKQIYEYIYIGNVYLIDNNLVDTGESFVIIGKSIDGNGETFSAFIDSRDIESDNVEIEVSIKKVDSVLKTIDPKFIKDMYYTEGSGEPTVIFPETEINMAEFEGGIYEALNLVDGNTYIVNFNGVDYTCVCTAITEDGMTACLLGDVYTLSEGQIGTIPTGEPFVIMEYPAEMLEGSGYDGVFAIMLFDESLETFTFSISDTGFGKVHKIPNKYLDLDWIPYTEIPETDLMPETEIIIEDNGLGKIWYDFDITTGEKIAIYLDGNRYEFTVGEHTLDGYIFPLTSDPNNYKAAAITSSYIEMGGIEVGTHKVSVKLVGEEVVNKLPSKYLPSASEKQVTITVDTDDSGSVILTADKSITTIKDLTEGELLSCINIHDLELNNTTYKTTPIDVKKFDLGVENSIFLYISYIKYSDTGQFYSIKHINWAYYNDTEQIGYDSYVGTIPVINTGDANLSGKLYGYGTDKGQLMLQHMDGIVVKASDNPNQLMRITVDSSGNITATQYNPT